jgi:thioredoxin reductase
MTQSKAQPQNVVEVVIIGAGPYGLSVGAHLAARGVSFRIFGRPMSAWADQMPKGMRLKSDGFASSLADPESKFTLASYCRHEGLEYKDTDHPVPLETFVSYGLAFQKRFVPNLENKMVVSVRQAQACFDLQLEDGEQVLARKVVVAVGISHFAHVPTSLSTLPAEFVSHSSAHSDLVAFKGRQIAVIGAGASALDLAALLHEAGASVQLIARSSTIRFHDPPQPRSLADRILKPSTGLGAGMQLFFYVNAPLIFRQLPEDLRLDRVRKTLGPAPGWFVKDQVVGKVDLNLGMDITGASVHNGRASLQLVDWEKRQRTIEVDHVVAATGYQVDLKRLGFLDCEMRGKIRLTDKSPALSSTFESSVPGLYFVGVVAANTFGPLMRFACGGRFTALRLSKHLADRARSMSALHENSKKEQAMERI